MFIKIDNLYINQSINKKAYFDLLIEYVKKLPENKGQIMLWTEIYTLPMWYIITNTSTDDINSIKPFIALINGKKWFFVFTDVAHVMEFARQQGCINKKDYIMTIAYKPLKAAEWICEYLSYNVYGVQFNSGKYGWSLPIEKLLPMYKYLDSLNIFY
jgi:hypothetical protein